ncbi:helix-turn-helix transcriptional regulator [Tistrella mobilis]|uniref:helix-turn-helix domain-containing protein n=1 Tax=Tistrella mobilis TaxID=171437 RepID=UPI00355865AE
MHPLERVARNLRRLRVLRGLSQEALAVDAGVDRTYISRLERRLENPTVAVLDRLAGALKCDIREFFDDVKGEAAGNLMRGRKRNSF